MLQVLLQPLLVLPPAAAAAAPAAAAAAAWPHQGSRLHLRLLLLQCCVVLLLLLEQHHCSAAATAAAAVAAAAAASVFLRAVPSLAEHGLEHALAPALQQQQQRVSFCCLLQLDAAFALQHNTSSKPAAVQVAATAEVAAA